MATFTTTTTAPSRDWIVLSSSRPTSPQIIRPTPRRWVPSPDDSRQGYFTQFERVPRSLLNLEPQDTPLPADTNDALSSGYPGESVVPPQIREILPPFVGPSPDGDELRPGSTTSSRSEQRPAALTPLFICECDECIPRLSLRAENAATPLSEDRIRYGPIGPYHYDLYGRMGATNNRYRHSEDSSATPTPPHICKCDACSSSTRLLAQKPPTQFSEHAIRCSPIGPYQYDFYGRMGATNLSANSQKAYAELRAQLVSSSTPTCSLPGCIPCKVLAEREMRERLYQQGLDLANRQQWEAKRRDLADVRAAGRTASNLAASRPQLVTPEPTPSPDLYREFYDLYHPQSGEPRPIPEAQRSRFRDLFQRGPLRPERAC